MEFPITTTPSVTNSTGQSQNNSSISQVNVGPNALQGDASTTVNLAAETGDADNNFESNDLAVTNILKIAGVSSIASGDFADAEFDII